MILEREDANLDTCASAFMNSNTEEMDKVIRYHCYERRFKNDFSDEVERRWMKKDEEEKKKEEEKEEETETEEEEKKKEEETEEENKEKKKFSIRDLPYFFQYAIIPLFKLMFEVFLLLILLLKICLKPLLYGDGGSKVGYLAILFYILMFHVRCLKAFLRVRKKGKGDRDLLLDEEAEEMHFAKRSLFFVGDVTMKALSISFTFYGILKNLIMFSFFLWVTNGFYLSPCSNGLSFRTTTESILPDIHGTCHDHVAGESTPCVGKYPLVDNFFEEYTEETRGKVEKDGEFPSLTWIEMKCSESVEKMQNAIGTMKYEDDDKKYVDGKVDTLREDLLRLRASDYRTILSDLFVVILLLTTFTFLVILIPRNAIFDLPGYVWHLFGNGLPALGNESLPLYKFLRWSIRRLLIFSWKVLQGVVFFVLFVGLFLHHPVIQSLVIGFKEDRIVGVIGELISHEGEVGQYQFLSGMRWVSTPFQSLVGVSGSMYCFVVMSGFMKYIPCFLIAFYGAVLFVVLVIKIWGFVEIEDLEDIYEDERGKLIDCVRHFGVYYSPKKNKVVPKEEVDYNDFRLSLQELRNETVNLDEAAKVLLRGGRLMQSGLLSWFIKFGSLKKSINVLRRLNTELYVEDKPEEENEDDSGEYVYGRNIRRFSYARHSMMYENLGDKLNLEEDDNDNVAW